MTDQTPSQPRVGQDDMPDAGPAPRPSGRRWRFAAAGVILLVAVAMAFTWQAIEHRRVRADLEAAASVFEAARDAHAREAAPESWQKAAEAMDLAMAELHRQQERFVLFRSYPRVHESLTKAIDAAAEAKTSAEAAPARAGEQGRPHPGMTPQGAQAPSGSANMKERAHDAVDAAKASLERANSCLARVSHCSRAMREIAIRKYVQRVSPILEAMARQAGDIDATFEKQDFFDATVAAETLKGKVEPLAKDLEGIAAKFKCKKSP